MSGFLVTLCHTMDDFPIALFEMVSDARAFIDNNPVKAGPLPLGWTSTPAMMDAYRIADMDACSPCCWKIWEFAAGKLVAVELYGSYLDAGADVAIR